MKECNKLKRCMELICVIGCLGIAVLNFKAGKLNREKNFSEIPDAVSSSYNGRDCRLIVIANSCCIKDKEKFARELFRICCENSFYTIKLSTDVSGWPSSLDVTVYLQREDIGHREPEMHISFIPPENSEKYNIKEDGDLYKIIIE